MEILALYITFHAGEVHSLKEKRSIVQRLTQRIRNTWPVCVMEVAKQDTWQTLVLGIVIAAHHKQQADSIADQIIALAEQDKETVISLIEREWR